MTFSLLYLPVAGIWLAASRYGGRFICFEEPIVLLTAVHFTFAGFASSLMAGCWAASRREGGFYRLAMFGIVMGPLAIAIGLSSGRSSNWRPS